MKTIQCTVRTVPKSDAEWNRSRPPHKRELELRGLAERILIVCPANLAFHWQRELKEKFDTKFVVLKGQDICDQFGVKAIRRAAGGISSILCS